MKLIIIWSNGDKQKVKVSKEFVESYKEKKLWRQSFDKWFLETADEMGCFSMKHAREVSLEE